VITCLAAVGGGGLIAGAAILPVLGFTAGGITAGSWAAAWMASYAGAVPAASLLAFLQSIGAAFLNIFFGIIKQLLLSYVLKIN
jgi:hypothetical protein